MQALAKDSTQSASAELEKMHLANYEFPVMMTISLPNGTIVKSTNANVFMETSDDFEAAFIDTYVHFFPY